MELRGWVEPERIAVLLAAGDADVAWLDSGATADTGWSIVGTGVRAAFGEVSATPLSQPGAEMQADWPAGPFRGGWIGWVDYETGARTLGVPASDSRAAPQWLRVERFLSFDHRARTVWAVSGDPAFIREAQELLDLAASATVDVLAPEPAVATSRVSAAEHAEHVAACREHIRVGSAYQLCLTTQFTVPGHHDALAVHQRLRQATNSHHGGFIRVGETALVSGSPELFLSVRDGGVRTKPIKGTRPRSLDTAADARLADELVHSEKERAENVMIVDLMRNDLSRVCEPGSVAVDALWVVESYPTVHQLVSTVSGVLITGTRVEDLFTAAFPAGSMTGAPKRRAMELLAELEGGPRGIYSGCFGWIGFDGNLDLAMVIRSVVVTADAATVGSGGGITWGSVPAEEVAEVGIKVRAPLAALGAVPPEGW